MEFNISKESLEIDGKYFSFRTEEELKNSRYTLYLYVDEDSSGTLFAKFGEAKRNTVWARYDQTGHTAHNRMTHLWESDKGDKEIHALLKNHTAGIGFRWAGSKTENELNTEEAYIIDSLEGFENLVSEITKAADSTPVARKERTPYGDITKLVDTILEEHKTSEKFNLDLCTRWGKTSTMLEIFRRSEYRVCFMCSYIKTVKTSYKTDIDTLVPYENMVMIDPDDFRDDPESCVKHCMEILQDPNKKIMYYIALTGTYDENEEIKEDEEAVQLENTDESIIEAFEWIHGIDVHSSLVTKMSTLGMVRNEEGIYIIRGLSRIHVPFGDYIIRNCENEFSSVSSEIFENTLEEV